MQRKRRSAREGVVIPDAGESAVLPQLVEMDGIHDDTRHPAWIVHDAALLRELAERIAILLGCLRRDRESSLDVGIERRQEDALRALAGEHAVARFEVETVGHVLGDGRTDRPSHLAQCQFTNDSCRRNIGIRQTQMSRELKQHDCATETSARR